MRRTFAAVTAGGMLVAIGCGAGGIRPRYDPFPEAIRDTIAAPAAEIILGVVALVRAESLPLRRSSAEEGYAETGWFNPVSGRWGGGSSLSTARIVRLRFWADEWREGSSVVAAEAANRRIIDPSLPLRETEAAVPEGHPGDEILRRMMDSLRARMSPHPSR